MADEYIQKQKKEYFEVLGNAVGPLPNNVGLHQIVELAITKAATLAVNAGFSGSWSDGGGGAALDSLIKFCAGVIFANTGELVDEKYATMVREYELENDPEYEEYKRLKGKFGELDGKK